MREVSASLRAMMSGCGAVRCVPPGRAHPNPRSSGILSSKRSPWKRPSPLCHPEQRRGICSSADHSWKTFFRQCHDSRRLLLLLTSLEQIVETANPKPAITIGLQQNIVAPIRVRLTMVRRQ